MTQQRIVDRYRFIPRSNGGPVVVDTLKDILYRPTSDPLPEELMMFGTWPALVGKLRLARLSGGGELKSSPSPAVAKPTRGLPRGVHYLVSNGKYRGRRVVEGVCYTTRSVDTPEEAYSLYLKMLELHLAGDFVTKV